MAGDFDKRNPHAESVAQREREEYHPSGWRESVEERTEYEPTPDYPTEQEISSVQAAQEIESPPPLEVAVVAAPETFEQRDWTSNTFLVDNTRPVMLTGSSQKRRRALVTYLRTVEALTVGVRLLRKSTDSPFTGYLLTNGNTVELFHGEAIWAVREDSTPASVSIITEFVPEDE